MLHNLPRYPLTKKTACVLPSAFIPYPFALYAQEHEVKTLKLLKEEIIDLIRRYAIVFPDVLERIERLNDFEYRCLVNDEDTGITKELLERLGYRFEESDYSPYKLYWITLKTREEKRETK